MSQPTTPPSLVSGLTNQFDLIHNPSCSFILDYDWTTSLICSNHGEVIHDFVGVLKPINEYVEAYGLWLKEIDTELESET
ncbi:MAG: hypothetical protein QQN63_05310 [Nitrosopumilus sp.]